jgi:hypothetical protein
MVTLSLLEIFSIKALYLDLPVKLRMVDGPKMTPFENSAYFRVWLKLHRYRMKIQTDCIKKF